MMSPDYEDNIRNDQTQAIIKRLSKVGFLDAANYLAEQQTKKAKPQQNIKPGKFIADEQLTVGDMKTMFDGLNHAVPLHVHGKGRLIGIEYLPREKTLNLFAAVAESWKKYFVYWAFTIGKNITKGG